MSETAPRAPTEPEAEQTATPYCRVTVAGPLSAAATRALRAQYGLALSFDHAHPPDRARPGRTSTSPRSAGC